METPGSYEKICTKQNKNAKSKNLKNSSTQS